MKFFNFFKDKSIAFYLCFGAGALGLVNAVIYAVYSLNVVGKTGNHFDGLIFALLLLGALTCALPVVKPEWKFSLLIPAVFFSASFGYYVNDRLIMFEEMINRIYGMMESGAVLGMVILVFALNLISFLSVAIASFMDDGKVTKKQV